MIDDTRSTNDVENQPTDHQHLREARDPTVDALHNGTIPHIWTQDERAIRATYRVLAIDVGEAITVPIPSGSSPVVRNRTAPRMLG